MLYNFWEEYPETIFNKTGGDLINNNINNNSNNGYNDNDLNVISICNIQTDKIK